MGSMSFLLRLMPSEACIVCACAGAMATRDWLHLSTFLFAFFYLEADFDLSSGELVNGRGTLDVRGNATGVGLVSISSTFDKSWCIAKDFAKPDPVQEGLNWVCGFGGADCLPIQPGNGCFLPNTVYSHASYAFNSYYQIHQHVTGSCDFDGVATVTYEDPSYSGCTYPVGARQVGVESKGTRRCPYIYAALFGVLLVLSILML